MFIYNIHFFFFLVLEGSHHHTSCFPSPPGQLLVSSNLFFLSTLPHRPSLHLLALYSHSSDGYFSVRFFSSTVSRIEMCFGFSTRALMLIVVSDCFSDIRFLVYYVYTHIIFSKSQLCCNNFK